MRKKALLPSYIYLLGRKIEVFEQRDPIMHNGEELDGYYEHGPGRIIVSHGIEDDEKFRVFCHECCHSYLTQLGIDQCLPKFFVECICQIASKLVEDILRSMYGIQKKK